MKIFISWSGVRSKAVAEVFGNWLENVIQATEPFISSRDIDKGALWFTKITEELNETYIGICCLTNENKDEPWILFEAGALAKGMTKSRICTLLIDIGKSDVSGPLAQFQHTLPSKSEMRELLKTINNQLGEKRLKDERFVEIFETNWPAFDAKFKAALEAHPAGEKPRQRETQDILVEILENTRSIRNSLGEDDSESVVDLFDRSMEPVVRSRNFVSGSLTDYILTGIAKGYTKETVANLAAKTFGISLVRARKEFDKVKGDYVIEEKDVSTDIQDPP